ncbi:hypothetical protein TEA_020020 [Camellia sinensis var. sinensis]|uniref:Replication protein A OB domain-containing protein n=1 Tax=Camellia sinensis var. sinensis TaxID=542762 RepID=A0A4S4D4I2_CAMSN|nr:hypothetical protein TEA_020020 [Camellia sinensis var. sinensis]
MKGHSWLLIGGNSKQKASFSPSTNQSTTYCVALNPDRSKISKPSISNKPINEFVQLKQEIEEFFRRFKKEEIYYNKASTGTLPALLTEYPKLELLIQYEKKISEDIAKKEKEFIKRYDDSEFELRNDESSASSYSHNCTLSYQVNLALSEKYRITPQSWQWQWTITASTLIRDVENSNEDNNAPTYHFVPFNEFSNDFGNETSSIDILAAVVQIKPPKTITTKNGTTTAQEIVLINEESMPTILTLWGQFVTNEEEKLQAIAQSFTTLIAVRLKVSSFRAHSYRFIAAHNSWSHSSSLPCRSAVTAAVSLSSPPPPLSPSLADRRCLLLVVIDSSRRLNFSVSKSLMMYGSDGAGGLASSTNQLEDIEHFGDVVSLDDKMDSFLSHDGEEGRDLYGTLKPGLTEHKTESSKGFSFGEVGCIRTRNKVTCCHFSSDGKLLASAGHDKKVLKSGCGRRNGGSDAVAVAGCKGRSVTIAAVTANTPVNLNHIAKAAVTGGGNRQNRYVTPLRNGCSRFLKPWPRF